MEKRWPIALLIASVLTVALTAFFPSEGDKAASSHSEAGMEQASAYSAEQFEPIAADYPDPADAPAAEYFASKE